MQAAYASVEDRLGRTDWMVLTARMQEDLVRAALLEADPTLLGDAALACAVRRLRSAAVLYPDHAPFREIPLYVKFNRAKRGALRGKWGAVVDILTAPLQWGIARSTCRWCASSPARVRTSARRLSSCPLLR
jgi:hypothetical protein